MLARFGPDGAWAHRQAGGRDERPVSGRRPPVEFTVTLDLEPPVDRVDTVAFSARGIAEQFVTDLAAHGLACTCLELQALQRERRGDGAALAARRRAVDRRRPRPGPLAARGLAVRPAPPRPAASSGCGSSRSRRCPPARTSRRCGAVPGDEDERAARALARVQTLLGHGSVLTPVLDGGRDPGQRTRLVPWGDEPVPLRSPEQPWPGQLPAPAPSVLLDPPRPAQLLDAARRPVVVTERGAMPAPPALFGMGGEAPTAVTSWAGPWPVDERWWSPDAARRVVRCQIVDVRGRAYLVTGTMDTATPGGDPRWQVDAIYD